MLAEGLSYNLQQIGALYGLLGISDPKVGWVETSKMKTETNTINFLLIFFIFFPLSVKYLQHDTI